MTKRINVILDLDNTLICAIDTQEEKALEHCIENKCSDFEWKQLEDEYKIFARPFLQEFLTWLFANFNVSIWTAASKSYALFIIEQFVLANRPERKIDYILFSHHCRESKRLKRGQKCLEMLSSIYPLGYDMNNTWIIDDHEKVYAAQPDNCLKIKPFEIGKRSANCDTSLLKIMKKLNKIAFLKL